MKQKRKWSLCKKIVVGVILTVVVLPILLITLILSPIIDCTFQLRGGQSKGEYYVQRINSSTVPVDQKYFMHMGGKDEFGKGKICLYSLENETYEVLAGEKHCALDYVVQGDMLYYCGSDGDFALNLVTGIEEQLPEDSTIYADARQKMTVTDEQSELLEKIDKRLSVWGYKDTLLDMDRIDQSEQPYIGLAQEPLNPRFCWYPLEQDGIRYDILFSYDPTADRCEILYQSKNNRTRIIGYQDGNVYLYQRDRIFRKNLETGKQEILAWLPKSLTYTFDWWEDQLIVIDHETNELVEVLEI